MHLGRPRLLHHPRRTPGGGDAGKAGTAPCKPCPRGWSKDRSALRGGLFRAESLLSSLPSPLSPTPGSPLAKGKSTINFFPGQMGSSQQCTVRMHRPFLFLQSCLPGRPPERQMNTLILSGILQSLSGRLPPAPRSLHFNLQQGRDASSGQDGRGRAWPRASALHSGAEADRGSVHPPARLGFQGIGIMIYIPPGL